MLAKSSDFEPKNSFETNIIFYNSCNAQKGLNQVLASLNVIQ